MTGSDRSTTRTLAALILLGIANHTVLTGSRVIVSLDALSMGASPFTVGVLMALYALLPMVLSVAAGRVSDRIGYRWPMRIGSGLIAIGAILPIAFPGFPALFASAPLVGVGFMAFQLAAQSATGEVGGLKRRTRNFTLLALGFSVSGFFGPLIAGFAIDHFGFRAAFAVFALVPLIPITALSGRRFELPARAPHAGTAQHGSVLALLRHRTLRRVFAVNALLSMSWDLHSIFVPIYGERIGLSASEIGVLLSSFAAATFAVRIFMGRISRRMTEHQVLTGALLLAGAVYLVYPLSTSVLGLLALSFTLGLGLGSSQPMVLSLLHTHAPPGRVGEAAGVRLSLVNMMSVGVPLALGAVGSSVGIGPVFWSVGTCLVTCGFVAQRNGPR